MFRLANPTQGCDTFICYRKQLGMRLGETIVEWMGDLEHNADRDFGRVYYSHAIPDANFINDVKPMIKTAKNIVIGVTEAFTKDFERIDDPDRMNRCITAYEIQTIMERFSDSYDNPTLQRPRIIVLHFAKFCDTEVKHFQWLAERVVPQDHPDREKKIEYLVNIFITAAINEVNASDLSNNLYTKYSVILNDLAIIRNIVRYRASTRTDVPVPLFSYEEQTLSFKGGEKEAGLGNHFKIEELAEHLIQKPKQNPNGCYGRYAIITADAGMGKTTQLQRLCHEYQEKARNYSCVIQEHKNENRCSDYSPESTVLIYFPAGELNNDPSLSFFAVLSRYLGVYEESNNLNNSIISRNYVSPEHFLLTKLFSNPYNTDFAQCLLCIDGFDEIQRESPDVSNAIEMLLKRGNAVIVSTRSESLIEEKHNIHPIIVEMDQLKNAELKLPEAFRPQNEKLKEMLRIPFYYTMYRETVTSSAYVSERAKSIRNFDDLFHSPDSPHEKNRIFYHPSPETSGELIWNFIMRHIFNSSYNSQSEQTRNVFYLMRVFPRIAKEAFERRSVNKPGNIRLTEQQILGILKVEWERFKDYGWKPFWSNDILHDYTASEMTGEPTGKGFITFCTRKFPILKMKEYNGMPNYVFSHNIMLEAFRAIYEINVISDFGMYLQDTIGAIQTAEQNSQSSSLVKMSNDSSICCEKIFAEPLKIPIMRLIGQMSGERMGLPYFDTEVKGWKTKESLQCNLLRKVLRLLGKLRKLCGETSAEVPCSCGEIKKQFMLMDTSIFTHNLYEILKIARISRAGVPDLSGIEFNNLDLSKCDLNNVIFSHHSIENSLCASFNDSRLDAMNSFATGHRALHTSLAITALYEYKNKYLISIDEVARVVVLDLDYSLNACILDLKGDKQKHIISNIVQDHEGRLWVTCDNELFCIEYDCHKQFTVVQKKLLPTNAVRQLVLDPQHGLCYHPSSCPLDRYTVDGSLVTEFVSGEWFVSAVVNQAGNTAYCFDSPDYQNVYSVNRLMKWERNENGQWNAQKEMLSYDLLRRLTKKGYNSFNNARLTLNETQNVLLVCICCKKEDNVGGNSVTSSTIAIEIRLDSSDNEMNVYTVSEEDRTVHAIHYGTRKRKYFSSFLSISFVNSSCETQLLRADEGTLRDVLFMPDTNSFLAITDNPIRIQEVLLDDDMKCYFCRQILPVSIHSVQALSMAFRFDENMSFHNPGMMGIAEHKQALRLVLWRDKKRMVIIDLGNGVETEETLADISLITPPRSSRRTADMNRFTLSLDGDSVLIKCDNRFKEVLCRIKLHPEWLFAGCHFDRVEFIDEIAPAEFFEYTRNISTYKPQAGFDNTGEFVKMTEQNAGIIWDENEDEEEYFDD